MPNRILRDGFVDSEAITALSDWAHRVYSNLLVKCDDAGRFDGRLEFIRSHLFPLGTSRRAEDFRKALEELDRGGLLIRYEWNGKAFLQVTKWQRCGSATTSRYPWRDGSHRIEYVCRETRDGEKDFVTTSITEGVPTPYGPPADGVASELNTETETESDTKTETIRPAGRQAVEFSNLVPAELRDSRFIAAWGEWVQMRRERKPKVTVTAAHRALAKCQGMGLERSIVALQHSTANSYQGIFEPKEANGHSLYDDTKSFAREAAKGIPRSVTHAGK